MRGIEIGGLALMLAMVVGIETTAQATTFRSMTIEELTTAAAAVARVRCIGSVVRMEGGEIWTVTSFEVLEAWKGETRTVIRVRLLGGRTAELTSYVPGVPRFRPDEEVVLFLEPGKLGDWSVTSWAQGTFRVGWYAASGEKFVKQDVGGYDLFDERARKFGDTAAGRMTIEELKRRVRAAVSEN